VSAAAVGCGGGESVTPPTTGTLEVTTSTSGAEQDADGYSVQIDAESPRPIGVAATLTIPEVTADDHTVLLGGLAANCAVSGENPRTISVRADETTRVSFAVTCNATTGSLTITSATSGPSPDPDGYTISIDGENRGALGVNAAVTVSGLVPGSHLVGLSGLAANCQILGDNLQPVTITAGANTTVTFTIVCATPPGAGSLRITTATAGSSLDPDGYTVSVDGATPQSIGINATLTIEDLAVGTHALALSGIAANCHLDGENPRTVEVLPGSTTVTFGLNCLGANALIAFTSNAFDLLAILVVNPDGTGLRNLTPDGVFESDPIWSPEGQKILFSKGGDLYVMDAAGGGRVRLAEGETDQGISEYRWSPDGRMIAYVDTRAEGEDFFNDLWVMQADGAGKIKVAEQAFNFSWSRDGRIVYTSVADFGDVHLRIINADGSGDVRLTNRAAFQPAWSPDGTRIAFVTLGEQDIFLINPDGTGEVNLTQGFSEDDGPTWSPDGSRIAFSTGSLGQDQESEVALMNRDGSNRMILTDGPGFDFEPVWSPDGTKIVFTRSENRDAEIYVMNAGGGNQTNVSNRPDTRETTPDWNGQGAVTVASRQSAFYKSWLRANDWKGKRLHR
jgi:TolB protein